MSYHFKNALRSYANAATSLFNSATKVPAIVWHGLQTAGYAYVGQMLFAKTAGVVMAVNANITIAKTLGSPVSPMLEQITKTGVNCIVNYPGTSLGSTMALSQFVNDVAVTSARNSVSDTLNQLSFTHLPGSVVKYFNTLPVTQLVQSSYKATQDIAKSVYHVGAGTVELSKGVVQLIHGKDVFPTSLPQGYYGLDVQAGSITLDDTDDWVWVNTPDKIVELPQLPELLGLSELLGA